MIRAIGVCPVHGPQELLITVEGERFCGQRVGGRPSIPAWCEKPLLMFQLTFEVDADGTPEVFVIPPGGVKLGDTERRLRAVEEVAHAPVLMRAAQVPIGQEFRRQLGMGSAHTAVAGMRALADALEVAFPPEA